jgi:hypothetical protein
MAETTADVRRDIEMTRSRISDTLEQLEHKLNVTQLVRDNPWPSLALAFGAGVLLSGSRADVKAAAATVTATKGASGRIGTVLDDLVSQVVQTFHGAIEQRIEGLASQVKQAIGAPPTSRNVVASTPNNSSLGFNQPLGGDGTTAPRAD